jgi:hypothetical protein
MAVGAREQATGSEGARAEAQELLIETVCADTD